MPDEGYTKAIAESDLPAGTMKTVDVAGESVLLVNAEGALYGMGGICTHEEWDLSEGTLEGTRVTCAGHGSIWDLATGKAEFDQPIADEPLYDVLAEDGWLYVKKR